MPVESDVRLGSGVIIFHPELVNLYGCQIGDGTRIGSFVEIQKNALIGKNCKISSHSFICEGVEIEDEVFIGHGVKFINDLYPRATTAEGDPRRAGRAVHYGRQGDARAFLGRLHLSRQLSADLRRRGDRRLHR